MNEQETTEVDALADPAIALLDGPGDVVLPQEVDLELDAVVERVPPRTLQDFLKEGVNPDAPTEAKPGTEDKVRMLAARYEAGLPLWNNDDRLDHGPDARPGIDLLAVAPMAIEDESDDDVETEDEAV